MRSFLTSAEEPVTLDISPPSNRRGSRKSRSGAWLAASAILVAKLAGAQDAIRYSLAADLATTQQRVEQDNLPYTIKSGDLRLLVTPSLGLAYNDNVNISNQGQQTDFIFQPTLGLDGTYPIGTRNLLRLNLSVGYDLYVDHRNYSGMRVQSGSQVAFDLYVKDFRFEIHDRLSFTQDPAGYAIIYGTAEFGNLQNLAGLSVNWDQGDVVVTVGYDHLTYLVTSGDFKYADHSSELLLLRPGFQFNPTLTAGLEGTATFTSYHQNVLNNYDNYSAGLYADWRPSSVLTIQPRLGYAIYAFQQTSATLLAQDETSWYVDVTIRHAITQSIAYSLSVGHQLQPGIEGNFVADWYVRPNFSWSPFKTVTLSTSFSYENGEQSAQGFPGAASETYNWLSGGFALGYQFLKNLTAGINYRYTTRLSDQPNRSYAQNLLVLQLTYAPR